MVFGRAHWPAWWLGGIAFIGIELVAHLVLQLRWTIQLIGRARMMEAWPAANLM